MIQNTEPFRDPDTLSFDCGGRVQIPTTALRISVFIGAIFFLIGLVLVPLSYQFSFPYSAKLACRLSLCLGGLAAILGIGGLDHKFKFLYDRKSDRSEVMQTNEKTEENIKEISWQQYLEESKNPEFIEVHQYPWYLAPFQGEIGKNDKYRFIYNPALNISKS